MSILLGLIFFLSGASALLFETLWFSQAGLALGNSIWASSLVLASFMAGLALGNGLVSVRGDRIRQPLAAYAGLEAIIGVTGAGLVFLLPGLIPALSPWLGPLIDQPWLLNALRVGIAFALLLLPATAMGATLPLLVSTLYAQDPRFGSVLGRLYGWNTLGAVAGALAGEALLFGWLGIRGSALFAAGCNALVVVLALGLAATLRGASKPAPETRASKPLSSRAAWLLASGFTLGGLLLALEVVWFRFLLLFVPGTTFAFALMLAVVLAGIGLGGFGASVLLGRRAAGWRMASGLSLVAGTLTVLLYVGFDLQLPSSGSARVFHAPQIAAMALALMLPVALLSGALFAFLGEGLHREIGGEIRSAGLLTLANTTGAALGSLLGGFVLLPWLGIEVSIRVLGAAYAIAALLAFWGGARGEGRLAWGIGIATAAAFVLAQAFFPSGLLKNRFLTAAIAELVPPETVVATREGLNETIVYTEKDRFGETDYHRLITNGHSMSSTSLSSHRYMKLFVYLPMALVEAPRRALLISYGVGSTARALVDSPELERIDIVDISQDVLSTSRNIAQSGRESLQGTPPGSPLDDPRVFVHVEDGRFFLQTTDRRFDLITGEPPPPKLAGIVNLYTREYFEAMKDRLTEGGIVSYWLPVHTLLVDDTRAILRAFCDVFLDCTLWTGAGRDWILLGSRGDVPQPSLERFNAQWRDPRVAPELRALGFEEPGQLGALFLADAPQLERMTDGVEPLVDDFPQRLSHRIGADLYEPWMTPAPARERFARSRVLRKQWPPAAIEQSLPFFAYQDDINRVFGYDGHMILREAEARQLPRIHELLEETSLETLPLWLLGSSVRHQRLAAQAARKGRSGVAVRYHLAAGAWIDRNWSQAAAHLEAASRSETTPRLLPFRAYALCRAGSVHAGSALLRRIRTSEDFEDDEALLALLEEMCRPMPDPEQDLPRNAHESMAADLGT